MKSTIYEELEKRLIEELDGKFSARSMFQGEGPDQEEIKETVKECLAITILDMEDEGLL